MSFAWRGSDRGMKGLSMQTLSTVALGGLALIFAIVSLLGFLAPGILLDPLGIIFDSPAGAAEMRSVYGGFFGTGAILFGLGSAREGLRRMALIGATMLLFAFSLGRLLTGRGAVAGQYDRRGAGLSFLSRSSSRDFAIDCSIRFGGKMSDVLAIDPWVNLSMLGGQAPPEWLLRVKEDYFKAGDDFLRELSPDELIRQMDAAGVEKAILSVSLQAPQASVLECVKRDPDRFFLAVVCDPTAHMKTCWALEDLVAEQPVVMARVVPFMHDLPPNHRDYYPL